MKKHGFTLVELLAVIVIIGLVAVIVFPAINTFILKSKIDSYNIQKDLIEKAAKKWLTSNSEDLVKNDPYHLNNINITLTTLKKEGYLEDSYIINPTTKKVMTGCVVASYQSNKKQYEFIYKDGKDSYSKSDTSAGKLEEEMAGCDSNEGYIYTYYNDSSTGNLEKTNGIKKSTNEAISLAEIFADFLINKKENGLVDLGDEYFYQGLNPTNYVKINGSDIVWNVLSINKTDKTIKLIAPGKQVNSVLISTSVFNASSYANSSDIKTELDAKIKEEIAKMNSNIIKEETDFYVGNISNISNNSDIIASEEKSSIFKGKIGLITASEYLNTKNTDTGNSYLTPSATAWTMNYNNINQHIVITKEGTLVQIDNDTTPRIVYPTIVINANLKSNGGSGISTDPYIIDSLSK